MKKIAVIVLLWMAMSTGALHAQWSITPEAGLTAEKEETNDSWRSRLKIGAGVEYLFGNLFSLGTGIYYAERDYVHASSYYPIQIEGGTLYTVSEVRSNRHYLQIPALAKFSWRVADDVRLNVGAGPYAGISLGGGWSRSDGSMYYPGYGYDTSSETSGDMNNGYGWYDYDYDINNKAPDWGLSTVVGLEVKNWVINLREEVSLTKTDSYQTISLSAGYKFKLGKK
ncbi:MAG: PorT family protein [Tannerella sp.]|nr:PorT family protein [Tannerella sp.]